MALRGTASGQRASIGVSSAQKARLWLSYQRYAILLGIGCPALVVVVAALWPAAWWLWGSLLLAAIPCVRAAETIRRKIRLKMVMTYRARRNMLRGTFDPRSVKDLCTDPCGKVVAREILTQSGMRRAERRALIRRLTIEEREESKSLVIVDRTNHKIYTFEGGKLTQEQELGGPVEPKTENPPTAEDAR